MDTLTSYFFLEIELEHECDLDPQFGNSTPIFDSMLTPIFLPYFNHFSESMLNRVPLHREIESPIFQNHIALMGQVVNLNFFWFEPILTPKFLLYFSEFPESVFIPAPFEPKLIIFHNHT